MSENDLQAENDKLRAEVASLKKASGDFLKLAPLEGDLHLMFIAGGKPISKDNRAYVESYGKARTALVTSVQKAQEAN